MKGVHGYKVFHSDWTCGFFGRRKQYTCPGIFEEDVEVKLRGGGMHFCEKLIDCFTYYGFNPVNKVAEVFAYGTVLSDGVKSVTDKLKIVREIPWDEVLRIVNTGKNCTGLDNTGDYNAGNHNSGDCNSGNYNTGCFNTGSCNTGFFNTGDNNTGDRNTGDMNTGFFNTGNHNAGNCNTGDWNISSFNTGCFMTEEQNIMMFNKPSEWTLQMWFDSKECFLLSHIPRDVVKWIESVDMTNEEKKAHPEHEVTGGYLKELDVSERTQTWWDNLSKENKKIIKSLPNFDPDIFYQCTGIKVD